MSLKCIKNRVYIFTRILLAALSITTLFTEIALSEESNAVLKMRWVIDEALRSNPKLRSARFSWDASKERVPQVKALDDPNIGFTYYADQVQTRVGEVQARVEASQKIPYFGKLRLKGEVAEKEAKVSGERHRTLEREIIAEAKSSFYELYWVYKSIEINDENRMLLERFVKIAQVKYATGRATQQDVLKAQVELSAIMNELITLEQLKETAIARTNILLNRHPESPLGTPERVDITKFDVSIADLYEKAKEISPGISIFKYKIERDKAAHKLAKKQYFPDFTFGFNYDLVNDLPSSVTASPIGEGGNFYSGTLSINVPIFQKRKYDAGVREADARLKSSERAYKNMENLTLFEVKDFHFKVQTSERLVKLYRDNIIPQAEQSLNAAEIGYQSGKVDFLNLIDSQRVLLDFNLAYYRAVADFGINIAQLERVVGIELARNP
ncbi:MAG: TolC family protein [Candidatus Scalindua sp. AMX11]|nr:MAG: TolC family protein [Candidatus Scalindua sp.]NOG83395.1 TolC family protein [Planctomycetota bacterium]RZV75092.1 MAG: TolC family protein [Candidatus Scalindua sp. SCAELEC01]TDE63493.1 MAG: TolC family protein [Candidatus Scalindua sp. AMX11]GJQ57278.1 MAG: RND transporter [Candidatus Scalindua sp.]